MGKRVEIPVSPPLAGHDGPVRKVIIREPTYNEYMLYGDPFVVAQAPKSGVPFVVEDKEAIAAYAGVLVEEPDAIVLEQGGLELAIKVKRAILSFFQAGGGNNQDKPKDGDSPTSPMSSSSPPADSSTPSAA